MRSIYSKHIDRGDIMKARILYESHPNYNCIINVIHISLDGVMGMLSSGEKVMAPFDEVQLIYDNDWEKKIMKHRDILEVKRPLKASLYMYYAIIESIEKHIGGEIEDISVLKEVDNEFKKVWNKRIYGAVNGKPIGIEIGANNYSNTFDIKIRDIDEETFIEKCQDEINDLKIGLELYTKRINGLMYTMKKVKDNGLYTSTHELSLMEP